MNVLTVSAELTVIKSTEDLKNIIPDDPPETDKDGET